MKTYEAKYDPLKNKGVYTKKQISYVNSIKDNDLRNHLLHQVRLRDIMECDRNLFEKIYNELLVKYKQKKVNSLQLEDYNKIKKGDVLILNQDNGSYKKGDEFLFEWSDGLSFVVSDKGNDMYLNLASILFFNKKTV